MALSSSERKARQRRRESFVSAQAAQAVTDERRELATLYAARWFDGEIGPRSGSDDNRYLAVR